MARNNLTVFEEQNVAVNHLGNVRYKGGSRKGGREGQVEAERGKKGNTNVPITERGRQKGKLRQKEERKETLTSQSHKGCRKITLVSKW